MNLKIIISTLLLLLIAVFTTSTTAASKQPSTIPELNRLHIAVSSNFHSTLKLLSKLYSETHPSTIIISSASTGKLTTQIRFGAPYDIFLAADERHPNILIAEDLAFSDSQYTYAQGQLVLISKTETAKSALEVIQSGHIKQLAIANPRTAPYGRVANIWLKQSSVQGSTIQKITSENISQTWQHFQHGGVDAALVALSQVLLSKTNTSAYWLLPEKLNHQLTQSAVILTSTQNVLAAEEFMAFLKSKAAKEVISRAGYRLKI
ncbi:MAG: molybdate transport system substrate-binding protein [Enterobacterales bacterium]|jgi:molybdate transport system substrate-binding protein